MTDATTSAATFITDAKHFIFGVDLSRDNGIDGALTGTDLSVVPMLVSLKRSAATQAVTSTLYHFFIEHDSFLKISADRTFLSLYFCLLNLCRGQRNELKQGLFNKRSDSIYRNPLVSVGNSLSLSSETKSLKMVSFSLSSKSLRNPRL